MGKYHLYPNTVEMAPIWINGTNMVATVTMPKVVAIEKLKRQRQPGKANALKHASEVCFRCGFEQH